MAVKALDPRAASSRRSFLQVQARYTDVLMLPSGEIACPARLLPT